MLSVIDVEVLWEACSGFQGRSQDSSRGMHKFSKSPCPTRLQVPYVFQVPCKPNWFYFLWNDVRNLSPLREFFGASEFSRHRGFEFYGGPKGFQDSWVSEIFTNSTNTNAGVRRNAYCSHRLITCLSSLSLLWHLQWLIYQYNFNFPGPSITDNQISWLFRPGKWNSLNFIALVDF